MGYGWLIDDPRRLRLVGQLMARSLVEPGSAVEVQAGRHDHLYEVAAEEEP